MILEIETRQPMWAKSHDSSPTEDVSLAREGKKQQCKHARVKMTAVTGRQLVETLHFLKVFKKQGNSHHVYPIWMQSCHYAKL